MDTFQKVLALQTKIAQQIEQQQFSRATDTQLAALKLAQGLNIPKLMTVLYLHLGQLLEQKGAIQKTVYAYEAAFKALKEEDHRLIETSRRLRRVSKSFQRPKKIAVPDVFSPAIATSIEEEMEAEDLNLKVLINIGNSYFAQPQLAPALNAFQQVLIQSNIEQFPLLKGQTLVKIGEIFRQQKKLQEAKEYAEDALKIIKKHGQPNDQRFALALKARLHFQATETKQAIPIYQQVIPLFEAAEETRNLGKVLAQLGQLYLGQSNFEQAKNAYKQALDYAKTTKLNDSHWHLFWGLGCCYWEEQDWHQAAENFEKSRTKILTRQNRLYTDEGKVAFLDSVQDVFNRLIESYLKIGTEAAIQKAFEVAETAKGQSLQDMMQGRNRRRARQKTKRKSTPTQTSFNSPIQQMSSGVPTIAPKVDSDEAVDFNQVMGALESEEPQISIQQMAPGMDVPNALPDFGALFSEPEEEAEKLPLRPVSKRSFLSFYSLQDKLLVWLKDTDGKIHFHEWPISKDSLAEKIQLLRDGMLVDAENRGITVTRGVEEIGSTQQQRGTVARRQGVHDFDLTTITKEFYQYLLQPFQSVMENESSTLVLIPHSLLWLCPFAALMDGKGKSMGSKYQLLYSPSIKTLYQIDKEAPYSPIKEAKALIVGNPEMSQADERYRFNPLKGAEREAIALGELFNAEPILQGAANQEVIEEQVDTANILHLATHGMAEEENPLESYLVLADKLAEDGTIKKDGLLKAREIMRWSIPCELVNLSACQTALGKVSGEGIIGLSRAFLVAGSRSVLVSLWNISDEATAAFMIQFYKYYLETENKALALQQTMEAFQKHPKYNHPVYWSGFTLVGSDN